MPEGWRLPAAQAHCNTEVWAVQVVRQSMHCIVSNDDRLGRLSSVIMWLWLWRRHPTDLGRRSAGSGNWNWLGASLGVSYGYEPHTPEDDSVTAMRASPGPPKPLPSHNSPLCCSRVCLSLSRIITPAYHHSCVPSLLHASCTLPINAVLNSPPPARLLPPALRGCVRPSSPQSCRQYSGHPRGGGKSDTGSLHLLFSTFHTASCAACRSSAPTCRPIPASMTSAPSTLRSP